MVTLEALDDQGRPCGELGYVVTTEVIGARHAYITNILVTGRAQRRGVGTALIAALMAAEPRLPIYVAPRSHNSMAGNALFDAYNRRHGRKVRFHREI